MASEQTDQVSSTSSIEKPNSRGGTALAWTARLGRWLGSAPVSLVLAVAMIVMWAIQEVTGTPTSTPAMPGSVMWLLPIEDIHPLYAAGLVAMVLSLGAWAESKLGSLKYLVIGLGAHVTSTVLVIFGAQALARLPIEWFQVLVDTPLGSVGSWLVATAIAAAALTRTVTRRRVILLAAVYLIVMVACAGEARDFEHLLAGMFGLVAGRLIGGPIPRRRVGSRLEARELVVVAIIAIIAASIVSMRSEYFIGPLASVRMLFETSISPERVAEVCAVDSGAPCFRAQALARNTSLGSVILLAMPWLVQLSFLPGLRRGRQAAAAGTIVLQLYVLVRTVIAALVLINLDKYTGDNKPYLLHELPGFSSVAHSGAQVLVPIAIPLAVIVLVVSQWRLFPAKPDGGWYGRFFIFFGSGLFAGAVVELLGGLAFRAHLDGKVSVLSLLWDYAVHLVPGLRLLQGAPSLAGDDLLGRAVLDLGPMVPWVIIAVVAFRSVTQGVVLGNAGGAGASAAGGGALGAGAASRAGRAYRDILVENGAGTLGWMTTWSGNSVWISDSGRSGVAFRGRDGAALTVTDPAAKPAELRDAMGAFADWSVRHGLVPMFYSVHDSVADVARDWGWSCVPVATETVIDLGEVEFKGKAFQDVRTAVNRAKKEGVEAEWMTWESAPPGIRDQITAISQHWAEQKPLPEMGFTLGGVPELDDPDVRMLVAIDADRTVHGATSWMPVYENGEVVGLTLDFMRRRDGGFRPVMEFLIAQAIMGAQDEGLKVLSLSGAPLVTDREDSGLINSVLAALSARLEPVYGFNSLYAFKHKFQPRTETMWLAVPEIADLARAARAISHAYLPDLSMRETVRLGTELLNSSGD